MTKHGGTVYVCGLDSRLGVSVYGGQMGDFTLLFGSKLKMRIIAFQGELWRCRRCLRIYIYNHNILYYIIYIIYIDIDSISIIFGVTMCDIPYLSSVSVSYFEGLPDWDFGTSKFSGPSPDEYCGLPDATASSSSSHSWAPRRSQRMGFTYGLTMFDHQEMGSWWGYTGTWPFW